ncbi:MAG: PD40 domain-containing protein [Armatimonadetes bacterium]|nr:PD40 domain-containing protein [Armatimonadota bacterium]
MAFCSNATNLVPNDTNGCDDVFVRDMALRRTDRVSVSSSGEQGNGYSWAPSISANGRYVAFCSLASNLVQGDTNRCGDVFVHDRKSGRTVRVSVSSKGEQANGESWGPCISRDGRFVAFISAASNLVPGDTNGIPDYFVHDCLTGETTRVSVSSSGEQAQPPWTEHTQPPVPASVAISGDGRKVAFVSASPNLVAGDRNYSADVFLHDRVTHETIRVSVSSTGQEGGWPSYAPSISGDGRFIAFVSRAGEFVLGDSNGKPDVFVRDTLTGRTTRVSVDTGGHQWGAWESGMPSISEGGRFVAFISGQTALIDTGDFFNVFVHERPWLRR